MAYKEVNKTFEDNEPVYTTGRTSILPNTQNSLLSLEDSGYSIDGEIVELQKRHYGTKDASQLLDRSFSELTKTRDGISPANFFNLYRELFFDIPKTGENSHTTLMLESKDYINDYIDPKDEKINDLLERVIELEEEKTKFPKEHPIFRNGSFLKRQKSGGPLGLMQEGRLRQIDYDAFRALRRPLGFIDSNGEVLPDPNIYSIIGSQTWNELPKWPDIAKITGEVPNLGGTLSDFIDNDNEKFDSLVKIGTDIQSSTLTKEDINALMFQLKNKIPSTNYGIEGNFDGTFQWDTEDLLPFNTIGNAQGEIRLLNTTSADTSYPTSIELEISDRFNIFTNKMAEVGLGINSPSFIDTALNSAQLIEFGNATEKILAEAFRNAKNQLISDLNNFANAIINGGGYEQYRWDVDPDRSTTDNNNKFYWVKEAIENEVEVPKIFAAINQIENNNDFVYTF